MDRGLGNEIREKGRDSEIEIERKYGRIKENEIETEKTNSLNPCVIVIVTSIVILSLDTIQHIESLSLLFNSYYLSFYNYYLKAV